LTKRFLGIDTMKDRPEPHRRAAPRWGWLLALLLLPLSPTLTPAAPPTPAGSVCAPAPAVSQAPVLLANFRSILGDQTLMIQIAVVVGAIGIFWLTRAIK
jgi:hypothetical protein